MIHVESGEVTDPLSALDLKPQVRYIVCIEGAGKVFVDIADHLLEHQRSFLAQLEVVGCST